ncbi:MAG TPA: ribonuclease HI [Bacteroidales bacterium]|jgi:ribonuclease HI|nr:ribonuclease HI [Bacteroidales bacterium]
MNQIIEIYTDGSCNPKYGIGGWAALILVEGKQIIIHESVTNTSHNRMELTAVINSIEYVKKEFANINVIKIFTDSQYVVGIPTRALKLKSKDFITNAGKKLQNTDLVKELIQLIDSMKIEFIKVKAHQKVSGLPNYNREVDKLSRKIVREQIKSSLDIRSATK